jgi:hypothetical protein
MTFNPAEAEIRRIAANFEACAKSVARQAANPKEHERLVQRSYDAIEGDRYGLLGPPGPTREDPLGQQRLPIHDQRRKALLLCN